jgi:hypothetical protein
VLDIITYHAFEAHFHIETKNVMLFMARYRVKSSGYLYLRLFDLLSDTVLITNLHPAKSS